MPALVTRIRKVEGGVDAAPKSGNRGSVKEFIWIVATVYLGVFSPRVVDAGRGSRPRCARGRDDRKIKVFFIL